MWEAQLERRSVCLKLIRHQNAEQWFVLLRQDCTTLEICYSSNCS